VLSPVVPSRNLKLTHSGIDGFKNGLAVLVVRGKFVRRQGAGVAFDMFVFDEFHFNTKGITDVHWREIAKLVSHHEGDDIIEKS